jgi:hypothetical protein
MKLILPPYECIDAPVGAGSALRAEASGLLSLAGITGAVMEDRPPEELAVVNGLTTPEHIMAMYGLAHLLPAQQPEEL